MPFEPASDGTRGLGRSTSGVANLGVATRAAATQRLGRPPSRGGGCRRRLLLLSGLLAAASAVGTVAVSASAPVSASAAGASAPGFPVTLPTPAGAITIAHRPVRIISLSPSATEDLFAIGAGHQVIAVDDDSDYPPHAPRTSLSGLEPNIEAIAHYRPDLVVIANDPSLVKSLGKLAIPVLDEPAPADLAGAYYEIAELGTATGNVARARALALSMRKKLAALVAAAPRFATPPTYFYELSVAPYYSATSSTLIGGVLGLFHLRNIADAAKSAAAAGGYPELSDEYIVAADPQLVFLADTGADGGQTPATVAARPGWSAVAAVAHHDVFALNADIASRWGPRLVDLAADVEHDLLTVEHQQR